MDFAIMFDVLEGGVVEPISWSKDAFTPERSIIVLDEGSTSLYLWHGARQGLVARRTALRQAESLKGHGYTIRKSIIGRDTKVIKEIDSRKVGRVPEDTDIDKELQILLGKEFRELEGYMVTFQVGEFEAMKASAYLVDVSRGGVIDHIALIRALKDKKIAGAALDVFPEEPLPKDSPLWNFPNVIISPHISGNSAHYNQRAVALFADNLSRYLAGESLHNQFNMDRGY